ncbi:DUF805 domain-containing protein [Shewanella halifaxensis]|uniref:DUF805 domain-containing protein n=1 Tax=Shewanella halifaxensis TaxID=271098 RepID=UPI000D59DF91|nr:DUF805 domain-containing protein [Shewanella halifaxensis]
MQMKSLLCVKGLDNSQRFATISGLIYLALFISVALVGPTGSLYVPGVILAPILALTSLRRLRDAGKPAQLALLAMAPFIFVIVTLVHVHSMMLLLTFMVLAVFAIGYLAMLPAARNLDYVQGYSGPVEMGDAARPVRSQGGRARVEPTLGGIAPSEAREESIPASAETEYQQQVKAESYQSYTDQDSTRSRSRSAQSQLAPIQQFIEANRKAVIIAAGSVVGCLLLVSLWTLFPSSETDNESVNVVDETEVVEPKVERISTAMPDGFSLALEEDVLIMRWLGESGAPENLWSLATAKGDKTCSRLRFNNGTEYRPIVVDLLADTGTEARFSPLDTEAIVVDMARRGNVSLCGYNFSLKGSQAALGKTAEFRAFL